MENKTLKIIFFIPNFNGGGAERALINLLIHWNIPEYEPIIVVRNNNGPYKQLIPTHIPIYSLDLSRHGFIASGQTIFKLMGLLRKLNPQILITFLSLPSIVIAHKLSGISAYLVASVQNPINYHDKLPSLIYQWALRQCHLVMAIAPGLQQQIQTMANLPKENVVLLPNSVEIQKVLELAKQPLPTNFQKILTNQKFKIVTACRLTSQKRLDILLKACALLRKQLDFELIILGEGELLTQLNTLAYQLDLQSCTHFWGFLSNPWQIMAQCDVFVLSSEYEGFGNVLIEAMACYVPVISTRAPFGPEFIINSPQCGKLVEVGNVEALAQAIYEVSLLNPQEKQQLLSNGHERAKQFDVTVISSLFAKFMKDLVTI